MGNRKRRQAGGAGARGRSLRLWVAGGAALGLALAGCSGGDDGGKASPAPSKGGGNGGGTSAKVLQSQPMAHADGPAHAELLALTPSANNTVTLRARIVNDGPQRIRLSQIFVDTGRQNQVAGLLGSGGLALVDGAGNKMYHPLTAGDGHCLCSDVNNVEVQPGKAQELYAVFPAPPVKNVMVWVPLAPPFTDVAIPSGSAGPAPGQTLDPGSAQLGRPVVRPLIGTSEGAAEAIDQDGNDTRVRLSADVLFALNKADLTPQADATLQKVAKQIDASRGPTVTIDGYTDNSGNDAINNPLSQRRAQAVEAKLKGLVTRQGVDFRSAGHGSADPVADNSSEEGRRKNRRVAVTFARPPEPAPPAAPPSAPPASGGALPVVASVRPNIKSPRELDTAANNLKFDVNAVHRDAGGLVTVNWTLTNMSDKVTAVAAGLGRPQSLEYSGPSTNGARLLDPAEKMRYWPVRNSEDSCLCTQLANRARGELKPKESVTYTDVYKVPASVTTVDVELPWFTQTIPLKGLTIK
ncbi:OmpA family protein [Actinomadura sp. K4S16]|uniref:OmpA family protein n=1 Tax=Actinomadura sp. K4S16 TaxID=1316147 RepID=UPI001F278E64|nr:OmpA family protein [Actinomadura sp. K4S16]